jgi:hypothetical protein
MRWWICLGLFLAATRLVGDRSVQAGPGQPGAWNSSQLITVAPTATPGGGDDAAREKALAAIKELGGKIKTHEFVPKEVFLEIDLSGTKVTDEKLTLLKEIRDLQHLDLKNTAITDAGLVHLIDLPKLHHLDLHGTKITDSCVQTLAKIKELFSVELGETQVTERGFKVLFEALPTLRITRDGVAKSGNYRITEERDSKGDFRYKLMLNDTAYALTFKNAVVDKLGFKDLERKATTYYHRDGPVGQVLSRFDWFPPAKGENPSSSDARMPAFLIGLGTCAQFLPAEMLVGVWSEPAFAVIRLNGGTHASYGRPFQHIHFFNNAPEVNVFSLPPEGKTRYFNFINDARQRGCAVHIIEGDERPTLRQKGPRRFYHALFVEVTRNDLRDINTALLTKEALAEFMDSLADKGILCFHTSHRYHNIVPAVVDAAKSNGFAWKHAKDVGDVNARQDGHWGSEWVMVARTAADLEFLQSNKFVEWSVPEATGKHVWTDKGKHDLEPLKRPPIK